MPAAKKKTTKTVKEKAPVRKKRATPVSFNDEKVDSIVKEITEGMKKSAEPEKTLEEEIAASIERKKDAAVASAQDEKEDLAVDAPFSEDTTEDEDKTTDEEPITGDAEKTADTEEVTEKDAEEITEEKVEEKSETESNEKNEDSPFSRSHEENPFPPLEEEKKRNFLWPVIYLVLFAAGMVTGFIIFDQLSSRKDIAFTFPSFGTPTPTAAPLPTATPTPEVIDLSTYKILLENGSGTGGEAARVQKILKDANFTIDEIGNADASDYEETVIKAKNGTNAEFLTQLRTELEKEFVVAKDVETLPDSELVDAVVVIGSEKNNE